MRQRTPSCVRASGVVVRRRGRAVVDHVDVVANAGEVLAVVGPSGSGKTTLLSVLAGLVRPDEGRVEVDGDAVDGRIEQRLHFGLVLQSHALVPVLDAGENVEVVLRARGVSGSQARDRAHAVLERVGLSDRRDRLVEKLSGGQQQRVAVARALAAEPELLLADEPTSELDAETRDRVIAELLVEARRGAIVVVATHDLEVAARCHSVLELVDGRVA